MIGRKEIQRDKHIWGCMGRELAALWGLILKIEVDPEYQAIMDRRTWDKLRKAQEWIDKVRSDAENRMARFIPDWDTHTFYPHDRKDLDAAIKEFRDKMKDPAAPLTPEELQALDWEPVWVERPDGVNMYYIASNVGTGLDLYRGGCRYEGFADYGKTWLAYRRKPETKRPPATLQR